MPAGRSDRDLHRHFVGVRGRHNGFERCRVGFPQVPLGARRQADAETECLIRGGLCS